MDHGGHEHHHHHGMNMDEATAVSSTAAPSGDDLHKHHNHDMEMGMGHSMPMAFNTNYQGLVILFTGWKLTSLSGLIGSCIGVFWMAVLYEGLKVFREYLLAYSSKKPCKVQQCPGCQYGATSNKFGDCDINCSCDQKNWRPRHPFGWPHLVQTLLHIIQVIVSYFLMLIFMTFNVYLCLSVVLGAGCGYLAFCWRRSGPNLADSTEHCH